MKSEQENKLNSIREESLKADVLRTVELPSLYGFPVKLRYTSDIGDPNNPNKIDSIHYHNECELYVNISGEVNFWVEGTIYPLVHGSIIITRPHELHHCLFNSKKPHKHYCFRFHDNGNRELLKIFFDREKGKENLIVLNDDKTELLISLCKNLSQEDNSPFDTLYSFLTILKLLKESGQKERSDKNRFDSYVAEAIKYINANLSDDITVKMIAQHVNVSVNTLENHFNKQLHLSPYAFLQQKRLLYASELLIEGKSVLDAAMYSGFPDYSHFISLFKKHFGITPNKFKKQHTPPPRVTGERL